MNDKLKQTLEKIKVLSDQNPEFAQELQKIAKSSSPANSVFIPNVILDDISLIREALSIRANKSVSYDFVTHQRLKDQLIIDNLRMENARLDSKMNDIERYISFCVNAFYQVESILNYYFYKTYSEVQDLVCAIENATRNEKNRDFRYKPTGREQSVGDIAIAIKINAFYTQVMPSEINKDKVFMGKLRKLRNDFSHRGGVDNEKLINNDKEFSDFYEKYSFDHIRSSLKKLVNAIMAEMEKPDAAISEPQSVNGVISSMLPSMCYVKYGEDTTVLLSAKLFSKVRGLKHGDKVILQILNSIIVDVEICAK